MNQKKYNCKLCSKIGEYKCSKWGKVIYCSIECQLKDWVNHKNNCININNKNNNNRKSPISLNKKMNISNIKNDKLNKSENNNELSYNKNKNEKNKSKFSDLYPYNRNKNNLKNRNISSTGTNDSGTTNTETALKESQLINEEKNNMNYINYTNNKNNLNKSNNIDTFDFLLNLKEIIFHKKRNMEYYEEEDSEQFEENNYNKLQNYKIIQLYELLKKNRKNIIEKVLLDSKKSYFFESTSSFRDKFIEIEKYIFNYILLIKYLYIQGDPISLIKANQALNYLAKELLDYKNNGLLVYSINTIMKRCLVIIRSNSVYKNINYCHEILKKYLLLISCLIKISKQLKISKLYYKFINHYGKVFDLALDTISKTYLTEKRILKSNLLFNVGGLFVKNNMLNSSIKLYKEVINIQNHLEQFSFIFGASYYNISILYYVMGDIKNCDLYLNDLLENISKYDGIIVKNKKFEEDFIKFKVKFLLFNAEVNMEKKNYLKAVENLKEVINKLEKISQKERNKTQQTLLDKKFNDFFAKNLRKGGNKNIYGKSNSIVSNMILSKDKLLKTKRKKEEKSNIEFLYDIDFYDSISEKIYFNEKIKEIVNGLFDAILFIQNEKEIKLKELDYYKKKLNKKFKKNNSENNFKRLKSSSIVYETQGSLVDINAKNLIGRVKINDNKYYSYSNGRNNNRSTTTKISNNNKNKLKEKDEKMKKEKEKKIEDNYYYNQEIDSRFIPEKTAQNFLSYFNDEIAKKIKIINNEGDISDFINFFILLTNLGLRQVEILNNTQNSDMPPILFKNLPIFFSRQFKNTLNPAQRNIFEKLRVLSLIRCKVLSDPNKKISVDNVNFNIFHANIKFNELKLKKYSDIRNKIREVLESGYDIFKKRNSSKYNKIFKNSQSEISQDSQDKDININISVKQYISKKSKQIQKCDSNSSNSSEDKKSLEEEDDDDYENIDFKYRNKFDIKKFRDDLIKEVNYSYMIYSKEEIENIILLIKSPIFIQMMNILDFKDIKNLEKDHRLMIELLKNEIKKIEQLQMEQMTNKEDSNSFSKSSENCIDIDEKDLLNKNLGLKHKYSGDFSSFKIFQNIISQINNSIKFDEIDRLEKFNKGNLKKEDYNNFNNILRTSTN